MTDQTSPGARLRHAVTNEHPLQVVGAVNAYHAIMAEPVGYRALYLSGGGVAAAAYGLPDLGMTSLNDVLEDVRRITFVTELPLLVDADTGEYHDPDKRSIADSVQIVFADRTSTNKVEVEYPLGHRRRRAEGIPLLERKFRNALRTRFPESQAERISALCLNAERMQSTSVNAFSDLFAV